MLANKTKDEKIDKNLKKIYWLNQRNMRGSTDAKLSTYLGSRRGKDPYDLWEAIKATHTAFCTSNPFLYK